jgi:hypothetical protein
MAVLVNKLSALLVLVACPVTGQDAQTNSAAKPTAAPTKLESFEAQTGSVFIKCWTDVGAVGAVVVDCRELIDASTGKKEYGLLVEVGVDSARFGGKTRAFVDFDEIDSLLKGLDYISKVDSSISKLKSFEATYQTRGGLRITVFNNESGKRQVAVSASSHGSPCFFPIEKLPNFKDLIESGRSRLLSIQN